MISSRVVTKKVSDFTDFNVCILSLRPTVTSNYSKSSLYFGLGSLDPLGHFTVFVVFSTCYFIGKILS